jgi:3-phosphoshikimate 1-carboxyvinyltransferase
VLRNVPPGDDTQALLIAFRELGIGVEYIARTTVKITPASTTQIPVTVDARLAGTTSRFLLAMCALRQHETTITGDPPLLSRPISELANALRSLGFNVLPKSSNSLPLAVSRPMDNNSLGNAVSLRGDISSQFISALMMIGSQLPDGLRISIEGELVSRSYVEMTASVMRQFGANVTTNEVEIIVAPNRYQGSDVFVEPDFSSAAFPICAAVISGQTVRIPGLALARLQGDSHIIEIVRAMGAQVLVEGEDIEVSRGVDSIVLPYEGNLADCSDLVPAVAVLASCAAGSSTLTGIGFIRAKESDRLGDVAQELGKFGILTDVLEDGLRIHGARDLRGAEVDTHHDHRLAMAFALLGLRVDRVVIRDSDVVTKSWPTYWEDMSSVFATEMFPVLDAAKQLIAGSTIVSFDLDKTLTVRDCVVPFMKMVAGRFHFWKTVLAESPKWIPALIRRDRDKVKQIFVRGVFTRRNSQEIAALGESFALRVSNSWMRDDVCNVLRWHQSMGHVVVLTSASLASYVKPLAVLMEVEHVLCTELETDGPLLTGEIIGANCRGEEKVRRLKAWADSHGIASESPWLTYAYGDSNGDMHMLKMAKHGVRVGRSDVPIPDSEIGTR